MGPKHTRDEMLAGAIETAREHGFHQLTFGRLAKHLGTSDRMVVYYFPTKDDLLTEVLLAMGAELQVGLASTVTRTFEDHRALAAAVWPALANHQSDPVFRLFFEANGLAAAGAAPFAEVVPSLVAGWADWAAGHLEGPPARRRAEAEATVALIDGLLLLRRILGRDAAERAARRLGVVRGRSR